MSTSPDAVTLPEKLRSRSREALFALAFQFLLGMAANLIGEPDSSVAAVVGTIVISLHILVGIGIIVVAVRVLRNAREAVLGQREALWALVIMAVTFLAGVGTMIMGSEWLSYLMSAGFLAGAALYVRIYVVSIRAAMGPAVPSGVAPQS
ncbi:MAG: hypothetical protein JWM49_795 [Microbacteriaceae bacterium]|jgi:hypothetical protein|nr:hypothetical protein [Microbacteriaceae bacterium]